MSLIYLNDDVLTEIFTYLSTRDACRLSLTSKQIHPIAGSVGQYAIQLAHLSGYKVVTTASPRNFELVCSLGTDAVFDYHDSDVASKVKAATDDSIAESFDTISLRESQEISARVVKPGGDKLVLLLTPIAEAKVRDDVEIIPTLLYTVLGRTFSLNAREYPASTEDRGHMAAFLRKLPDLVKEGKIMPNRVHVWEGRPQAVPEGLQYMREGKVSAEKIVYRL